MVNTMGHFCGNIKNVFFLLWEIEPFSMRKSINLLPPFPRHVLHAPIPLLTFRNVANSKVNVMIVHGGAENQYSLEYEIQIESLFVSVCCEWCSSPQTN